MGLSDLFPFELCSSLHPLHLYMYLVYNSGPITLWTITCVGLLFNVNFCSQRIQDLTGGHKNFKLKPSWAERCFIKCIFCVITRLLKSQCCNSCNILSMLSSFFTKSIILMISESIKSGRDYRKLQYSRNISSFVNFE